ncbi:YjzD family protein [Heyndrickxia coagulans]|uniref:YjzD family protein n=1 Tax=Heyndrickxia coagulans TaxID=1398 RepID=UPI002E1BC4AD|nr:YjzD family protein [Heyndrickxia coagulans]
MKYIVTIFWVFLLSQMLGYVGSAMSNSEYSMKTMAVMSLVLSVVAFIVHAALPKNTSAGQ